MPAALAPLLDQPAVAAASVFHAAAGRLHVFPGPTRAGEIAEPLARAGFSLLEAVAGAGDPAGVAALEPIIAPQSAVLALRARLRDALDPAGTMACGPRWARGEP